MTREKAIEMCEAIKHYLTAGNPVWSKEEVAEAMTMAIIALDREQRKYDAICNELLSLKSSLSVPLEAAVAYENSISVVRKYARLGESDD